MLNPHTQPLNGEPAGPNPPAFFPAFLAPADQTAGAPWARWNMPCSTPTPSCTAPDGAEPPPCRARSRPMAGCFRQHPQTTARDLRANGQPRVNQAAGAGCPPANPRPPNSQPSERAVRASGPQPSRQPTLVLNLASTATPVADPREAVTASLARSSQPPPHAPSHAHSHVHRQRAAHPRAPGPEKPTREPHTPTQKERNPHDEK